MSFHCCHVEATLLAGRQVAPDNLSDASVFGQWQLASLVEGDIGGATGALDVIGHYLDWSRRFTDMSKQPAILDAAVPCRAWDDGKLLLPAFFPLLWIAWGVVVAKLPGASLALVAEAIATCNSSVPPDDEMLALWLERRAVLAWFDAHGIAPVLAAYNQRLRPALAHYVALRRPLSAADLDALRCRAQRHGEVGGLEALLP